MPKNSMMLKSHRLSGTLFALMKKGGLLRSNCDTYPVTATKRNWTKVRRVPVVQDDWFCQHHYLTLCAVTLQPAGWQQFVFHTTGGLDLDDGLKSKDV